MPTSEFKAHITQAQQIKADMEDLVYDLTEIDSSEAVDAEAKISEAIQLIEDAIGLLRYS